MSDLWTPEEARREIGRLNSELALLKKKYRRAVEALVKIEHKSSGWHRALKELDGD